jgi:acrylyl-CoA reductase (NADPH)
VNLLGIDSVSQPYDRRRMSWDRLTRDLPLARLEQMIVPATLADLPRLGTEILAGKVQGRVVIDVNA